MAKINQAEYDKAKRQQDRMKYKQPLSPRRKQKDETHIELANLVCN